jgi:hypothetical protein
MIFNLGCTQIVFAFNSTIITKETPQREQPGCCAVQYRIYHPIMQGYALSLSLCLSL